MGPWKLSKHFMKNSSILDPLYPVTQPWIQFRKLIQLSNLFQPAQTLLIISDKLVQIHDLDNGGVDHTVNNVARDDIDFWAVSFLIDTSLYVARYAYDVKISPLAAARNLKFTAADFHPQRSDDSHE